MGLTIDVLSLGRVCVYDEDAILSLGETHARIPTLNSEQYPNLGPLVILEDFRNDKSRQTAVNSIVAEEVRKLLGSQENVITICHAYFNTVHLRLPILSRKQFDETLFESTNTMGADIKALCLAMFLVQQRPQQNGETMQTLSYVSLKTILSLLEVANRPNIQVTQCRVLVAYYELAHGLHPAALLSIGACAKAARLISLQKSIRWDETGNDVFTLDEERRRTWWAIFNLDRCVNPDL